MARSRTATVSAEPRPFAPAEAIPAVDFVEFFAGIGLVRLALEQLSHRCVFANDYSPEKRTLYSANFDASHFVLGDVHQLTAEQIPAAQMWTASFPCTDLSIAGAQAGLNGTESGAFWAVVRLLKSLGERGPDVILFENVPGFLQANDGDDLATAIRSLNELGFACDVILLDAACFVPQSRLRLFLIAERGAEFLDPTFVQPSVVRPESLMRFMLRHADLGWHVRDLPSPPRRTESLSDILESLPDDDPAWWSLDRARYFRSQLSDRHSAIAESMIAGDDVSYATAFRRIRHGRSMAELRTDGLAGCLRTPRGGSARQILFAAGRGEYRVRLLTARECARLQGVPDSYRINVPLNQALFGFGDAVCVPAVRWIAEHRLHPVFANDSADECSVDVGSTSA